jgi:hypothetical protein
LKGILLSTVDYIQSHLAVVSHFAHEPRSDQWALEDSPVDDVVLHNQSDNIAVSCSH